MAITTSPPSLELRALRERLLGDLVLPGDDDYDAARRVWNLAHDRHPALVVRAHNAGDVQHAVRFAREHDLRLAIRSGGHSFAGHGTVDGGLVLDLGQLRGISVDSERRRLRAQPGATSELVAGAAHAHGLALPTGDTGSVALGGLTLGGGMGWLVRKHGLTIDWLESVELVTADGQLIVADADAHPDLFWALRGGGGNFGVATSFTYRLAAVDMVYGGLLVLPAGRDVLAGYLARAAEAPEDLSIICFLMRIPPVPFVAPEHHGQPGLILFVCFDGNAERGARALAPLRALASPWADTLGPMPYPALFQLTGTGAQPVACHGRSGLFGTLDDAALDDVLGAIEDATSDHAMVELRVLGGAMARVPAQATAFAHRDQSLVGFVGSGWERPADEPRERRWVDALWAQLARQASGAYANFLAEDGEAAVRRSYPGETGQRLAAIKRRYDPGNLFRVNQNIRPS